MELKECDILLYKKSTKGIWRLIDGIISYITKSEYVHSGIVLEVNKGCIKVGEHLSQGFTIWDNYSLLNDVKSGSIDVYRTPLTPVQQINIINTFYSYENEKYDYKEILDQFLSWLKLPTFFDGNKLYTCASKIVQGFKVNKIILVNKKEDSITPKDLSKSKILSKVDIDGR